MNENSSKGSAGMGLGGILLVVFIVLKLTNLIDWSWWWVLSPMWIGLLMIVVVVFLVVLGLVVGGSIKKMLKDNRKPPKAKRTWRT